MEQMQDYRMMMEQMNTPAFLVQNGNIIAVNQRATQYLIEADTPIAPMLASGAEEYSQFQQGYMYLNVYLCGIPHACTVLHLQDHHLFTVEEGASNTQLQILALAAQQLYMPISELSLLTEQLADVTGPQKAKIKQNLHKLQRIIGNMSDAGQYSATKQQMVTYELCALLEEVLEKAQTLLSEGGTRLIYSLPAHPIYSLADPGMLKRAIYNLISNAAKFTPAGNEIHIDAKHIGNRLYLSVTDGSQAKDAPSAGIFHRYTRQPGLEDPRFGLGLGMTLIHGTAVAHGGTVLAEQTDAGHFKITMTLAIQKNKDTNVRAPILIPDVYGGNDQALIELSDVLSYQLYTD